MITSWLCDTILCRSSPAFSALVVCAPSYCLQSMLIMFVLIFDLCPLTRLLHTVPSESPSLSQRSCCTLSTSSCQRQPQRGPHGSSSPTNTQSSLRSCIITRQASLSGSLISAPCVLDSVHLLSLLPLFLLWSSHTSSSQTISSLVATTLLFVVLKRAVSAPGLR